MTQERASTNGLDWQRVLRRRVERHQLIVETEGGDVVRLQRFAMVGHRDCVGLAPGGRIFVEATRAQDPVVPIHPVWRKRVTLSIAGQPLPIRIKEIETAEEFEGYERLTKYHYKSGPGPGRRAPLIATTQRRDLPCVVGFVEVCSTFLVNVPRKSLFDAPFHDERRGVQWERWDIETAKRFINVTARISRCVVLPELRGLGLATVLADAASRFAFERWHYGGHRPSFLEITAEMLRYWPFVKKSGFVYLGDTEGNEARLRKSMSYLLHRKANGEGFPKGGGGIVTMHRSHANTVDELIRSRGWSTDHLLELLTRQPEQLRASDWIALHSVYRRPKPVYMKGLTPSAKERLRTFAKGLPSIQVEAGYAIGEVNHRLALTVDRIEARCDAELSKQARQIQEAFGIVTTSIQTEIVTELRIEMDGGETLLVSGPSGSGKSLLLRAVLWHGSGERRAWCMPANTWSSANLRSRPLRVATWRKPQPAKSPIGILSSMGLSLHRAMQLLSAAGLAEASLFVRPSATLSTGQYYRLGLAIALAKRPELLVIDEFCESLDDFATAAVCRRLAQIAKRERIILVVATSNGDRIATGLSPSQRLYIHPTGSFEWD